MKKCFRYWKCINLNEKRKAHEKIACSVIFCVFQASRGKHDARVARDIEGRLPQAGPKGAAEIKPIHLPPLA